jgi:hypothetical protein
LSFFHIILLAYPRFLSPPRGFSLRFFFVSD